jgi:hypothetical protein
MNDPNDLGQIREDLRGVSKAVFSKLYRLEIVAVACAQEPPIWSRRLARTLDLADNQVASELVNFADMGALQRFPAEHDRRKIYQAVKHPLWGFGRSLLEQTIRAGDPEYGGERIAFFWETVLEGAEPVPIPG